MTAPSLRFSDLARLRLASDPQLAAGGLAAYVESWLDLDADRTRRAVVLVSADSQAQSDLAVPAGDNADSWCPRWSPDGSGLALITATGRTGRARAALWRRGAPALVPLAEVPGEVTELTWSPAGRMLAVSSVRYDAGPAGPARSHPPGPAYVD